MSSKVNLNSVRIPTASSPSDVLTGISNRMASEDAANRQLQAQLVRQRFLDDRYNAEKAEAKQNRENLLKASILEASAMPISYESTTDGREDYVSDDVANVYDVDKIIKDYNADNTIFDQKKVDVIPNVEINPENKKLYDIINKVKHDPRFKTKDLKDLETRRILEKNGYKDDVNSENEGFLNTTGEVIGDTLSYLNPFNFDTISEINEKSKTDNYIDFIKEKAKTYDKNTKTNKEINRINEKAITDSLLSTKIDNYKTGEQNIVKSRDTKVPIKSSKVINDIYKKSANKVKEVEKDKTLSIEESAGIVKGILKQRNAAISRYDTERKTLEEAKLWKKKKDYESKNRREEKKYASELKEMENERERLRTIKNPSREQKLKEEKLSIDIKLKKAKYKDEY